MPYVIAILVFLLYLLMRHFSGNRLTVETELSKKPINLPVDTILLIVPVGEESVMMTDDPDINQELNS